jgi:glycosyltransferase involved in cell wall biosynthesis
MEVSVVIPTRNRKARLISLLQDLSHSSYPIHEVIIVDASDDTAEADEYSFGDKLKVTYLRSKPSVCIQRNIGIRAASSPWIFICDDDIEVPTDYLKKIATYIDDHPDAGAVSGIVLQQEQDKWVRNYPITSSKDLLLRYIFQLSVWGEITCRRQDLLTRRAIAYYKRRGNHISKAGWPVITDFSGKQILVPVYGLGASVIRKDWLIASPYEEVLDRHGIGDNYGVVAGFPIMQVHLLNDAFTYHHQESVNRLQKPLQYYRRVLALDYFVRTKQNLRHVRRAWLLWSLLGNVIIYSFAKERAMLRAAIKTFIHVALGKNPYALAARRGKQTVEPRL